MVIGIKNLPKLAAITVITCCAVFVCTLFMNYNIDITKIKDIITTNQGIVMYEAQVSMGKMIAILSGGCLAVTAAIMLIFYIKNYIDSHKKELGILKALGYSNFNVAKHFWLFGMSVFTGCILGFAGASLYMPSFYEAQNKEGLFPDITPQFHPGLAFILIILPTVLFCSISIIYAFFQMKSPVLHLLKGIQKLKSPKTKSSANEQQSFILHDKKGNDALPFLQDLRKNTLRSRKILVFFVGFSAFCFSSMTQMSMSMDELSSETFSMMIISIGLILALTTLLISLTSVIRANTKSIAIMKVFGYSHDECSKALLNGYRPVSYIGFAIGTIYQYALLKITLTLIFADFENLPEYSFNLKAFIISFICFIIAYELIILYYSKRISRLSIKEVMLD